MSGAALVTSDGELRSACGRLALLAGATVRHASAGEWPAEPVVLLGQDALVRLTPGPPAHDGGSRRALLLVCTAEPSREVLLAAVAAGVMQVAVLPRDERVVLDALSRSRLGASAGRLVAVSGASGGVGASTLCVALAVAAADGLLVDLDHTGGGVDAVVGLESAPGPRWSALREAHGAVSAEALRGALPCYDGVRLLSCDGVRPPALALSAVVAAWCAAGGDCVVDLPRWDSAALAHVSRAVVVCAPDVPGVVAARRLLAHLLPLSGDVVVVRRPGAGLAPGDLSAALGVEAVLQVPWRGRIAGRSAAGLPAAPDAELVRFAAGLLP